jgi:preprotein translocase subunit SecD
VRSRDLYSLIFILVITGLALWIDLAPGDNWLGRDVRTRLGLDLQGGTQVLLRATQDNVTAEELRTASGVIDRRVNGLGVGESVVQTSGNNRIIVELPGVANPEQAVDTLRGTGRLEFIDPQGQQLGEGQLVRTSGNPNPVVQGATVTETQALQQTPVFPSITDGKDLDTNQVAPAVGEAGISGSRPAVSFAFRSPSQQQLATFTQNNVGKQMCIVLDNRVQSCPVIESPLTTGSGIITTQTRADADRIFNQLKYGALPIPLVVETSRTVSATLGQESVDASLIAGAVGLVAVALFMILYYRLPGVIAVVALMVYTALTFAIYRFIPVTLTLSGIAGFILSIGLAVDENVLIFARIREEFRRRRDLRASLEPGFNDSWSAIRDSAIATLITSGVLFAFGNSFGLSIIKGFAVTLGLGTVISVFTAVVVTRTILRLVIMSPAVYSNPWLFGIEREELAPAPRAIEPETV